MTIKSK